MILAGMRGMIQSTFLFAGLGVLLACTGTSKTGQGEQRFGGKTEADSLFYSIERTPCFGRCATYEMKVYRSGYATFNGKRNVPMEGMHHTQVPKEVMEKILSEAERIGFFNLQDKYDGPVTDLPSTIVRVVSGSRDKQVRGRYKMPEGFRGFAQMADSLLIPLAWTPLQAGQ